MPEQVRDIDKLLGGVVAELVKAHGGVNEVARKAPVSASSISRWQAGRVGLSQLAILARALDVTVTVTVPPDRDPSVETKENPPAWAEGLMQRDEVVDLVRQVEERVTTEISRNREVVVAALARELAQRVAESLATLPQQLRDALARADGAQVE